MKIQLVHTWEADGEWYRVLRNGQRYFVSCNREKAQSVYDRLKAGAGDIFDKVEVIEEVEL